MAEKSGVGSVLNFNVGVLGHVDSGKTSISKALSTIASTASFDKNPQSRERGITLDLGFSSFAVDLPQHLKRQNNVNDELLKQLQFTLVDCPGHASLIKTIIGGAQIIDIMLLVIDVTKGMQTQTAECLIIGEILCQKMIVVLNKVDLIDVAKRDSAVEKMKKRMGKTLENTKFSNCPIIAISAHPGGAESSESKPAGIQDLVDLMSKEAYTPVRDTSGPFLFSVDHCFSIRGQGTVMTGTILKGSVAINDTVEIPALKVTKKVKSMQMYKSPVQRGSQGDRIGICVTQFDPKLLERGLVCSVGSLPTIYAGIARIHKIPYFKGECLTKSKFHITIGHDTVMGRLQFFGPPQGNETNYANDIDFMEEYVFQEELADDTKVIGRKDPATAQLQFVLIEFDRPVTCPVDSLLIGSRFDSDINLNTCRLAFHGRLVKSFSNKDYISVSLPTLRIYKVKSKEGVVERVVDDYSLICRSMFKKETNLELFSGLKVSLSSGELGIIEGSFGQSGKVKIRIPSGLSEETKSVNATQRKKKGKHEQEQGEEGNQFGQANVSPTKVILSFKKYMYDSKHKIIQT